MTVTESLLTAAMVAERQPTLGQAVTQTVAFLDRHPRALHAWASTVHPAPARISAALLMPRLYRTPPEVAAAMRRAANTQKVFQRYHPWGVREDQPEPHTCHAAGQ